MVPDHFVLDAFALLALFGSEPGTETVRTILERPENRVYISAINLGEVYYTLVRRRGRQAASVAESTVFQQPNLEVVEPAWDQIRAAAEIKAAGGLSFADCFAVALARSLRAPLVTGDPEIAPFEQRGAIHVVWLPRR